MDSFTHKSPAKINTFLNVLSKRNDGYHNIYTHFELIDIFDEINFVPSVKSSFFCDDPNLIKNNIIEKTCSWFNEVFNKKQSFNINLKKNIPYGSGLGSGSSNSASTLIFLCMFHGEKIKNLDKTEISKKLGADVPIFLEQKSGFASGVGEVFEKEHSFKSEYLIISPNFNISTKDLYNSKFLQTNRHPDKKTNSFFEPLKSESHEFKAFYDYLIDIGSERFRDKLKLTGTGSSVFLENPLKDDIELLKRNTKKKFRIFVAKSLEYN